jgi:hypothetical protein
MISITYLEPTLKGEDPFRRSKPNIQEPIKGIQGDIDEWKSYKLERLINKHIIRYNGKVTVKYLAKYKSYSLTHNEWFLVKCLGNVKELVQEYKDKLCSLLTPR